MKYLSFLAVWLLSFLSDISGQEIWFTQVPEWGNATMNVYGKVNVNPPLYKVAGYIFIEEAGGWWTKPTIAYPAVPIAADSSFVLDITTGGLDAYCTRIITFLMPINDIPPQLGGAGELPASLLENYPYSIVARPHGDRKIEWSGIGWTVKRSVNNISVSPGPNKFSSADTNVYIDSEDRLHLTIKNNENAQWFCTEVIADTSFGFGKYSFNIASRVDTLDVNTVFGLFTWDDVSRYSVLWPDPDFREYDIEFGYWGDPDNDAGQYAVQPYYVPGNIFRFPVGSQVNTIHIIDWQPDTVFFSSLEEDSTLISEFVYYGSDLHSPDKENIRLNLWLFNGTSPQTDQEVILSEFGFTDWIPDTITWNGNAGHNWDDPDNWSIHDVPGAGIVVMIPDISPNPFPVITVDAYCEEVVIEAGAILIVAPSGSITVGGSSEY
jgi:hypothetical protein